MKVIVCENYDEMSAKAFEVIKELLDAKKDAVLGLATGSSPVGLYKEMIQYHKDGYSYKDIKSYNLDEYVGIDRKDPQSYYTFMYENLFKDIDIDLNNNSWELMNESEFEGSSHEKITKKIYRRIY